MDTSTLLPSDTATSLVGLIDLDLPLPPALTVKQTSKLLGIGLRQTYDAIHAGEIQAVRIGRRLLVPTCRVLELLGLPADQLVAAAEPAAS